jgi:hypothetical protein
MTDFTVDTAADLSATNFHTIQEAVNAALSGDVIKVSAGVYSENVVISTSGITLQSVEGRGTTSIVGSASGPGLGTITIAPGADNVTIGGAGQGFKIVGFDGTNPGIENAAIYLQGAHANITIRGNEIEAKGELALASEYAAVINGAVIDGNLFSGATFDEGAGMPEFSTFGSSQFTIGNVPRPLVYFGNTRRTSSSRTMKSRQSPAASIRRATIAARRWSCWTDRTTPRPAILSQVRTAAPATSTARRRCA